MWQDFDTDVVPDPRWAEHTRAVVQFIVERNAAVRGREEDPSGMHCMDGRRGAASSDAAIEKAVAFLNGDIRNGRLTHCEKGCGQCANREEACQHVYAALSEIGAILPLTACIPSRARHRWGSYSTAVMQQGMGIMISDIAHKVFEKAFPSYDAGLVGTALGDNDDDDDTRPGGRKYIRNKA
jgi:hypothetical protein